MSYLRKALRHVLPPDELRQLPAGFDKIGHVAIISLHPGLLKKQSEIAEQLLKIKGVRTVAIREGPVYGRFRRPRIKVIAGEERTETVHREHGCLFKLDVAKVMFSVGNLFERGRLVKLVGREETVVDMFAGVGQFTIPIAKHAAPRKIYAIELNPVAFRYLQENAAINRVGGIVEPVLGDCEKVAPVGIADRVIMGILHVAHKYLPLAIRILKPEGGIIHYHESVPRKIRFERPVARILSAASGGEVEILKMRVVKKYAPGVDHVVIDAKVKPPKIS
jgi:tRNA wybutosine-synthesizing protein 2